VIHLYAFAEELVELPELEGLDGAPISSVRVDGIDVVVSRHDRALSADRAHVLAHGRVVEALVDLSAAVLPVRFGEGADDLESLVTVVRDAAPILLRGLEHVRGCVEVGLRVSSDAAPAALGASTGTEYLRLRHRAAGPEAALDRELRGLARDAHPGAYLVPVAAVDVVKQRVRAFASAHPELSVLCTGPWAPYSFADDRAA
jgi:hypothetical protein